MFKRFTLSELRSLQAQAAMDLANAQSDLRNAEYEEAKAKAWSAYIDRQIEEHAE